MRGQKLLTATVSAALLGLIPGGISATHASITLDLTPVDNSALLSGYTTYDLSITTDTDWTVAAGLLELTAGNIYQHGQGADTGGPYPLLVSQYPELEFDTYVIGNVAGGAGDLGAAGYAFSDSQLSVSWFNVEETDLGTNDIGRLTLSDDAQGQLSLLLGSAGMQSAEYDVTFSPGLSPVVSQIIEVVEEIEEPTPPGTVPDGWIAPSGWYVPDPLWADRVVYPYQYLAPDDIFRSPRLYNDPALYQPRDRERDYSGSFEFGHAKNTLRVWEPRSFEPSSDDQPSLLPEPGALVLIGVGLGAAVLRRR